MVHLSVARSSAPGTQFRYSGHSSFTSTGTVSYTFSSGPEERRKVYVVLDLTVEALADGSLKMSGAFGEETPVWEDVGTSRRFFTNANLARLEFTLICKVGGPETAFKVDYIE
jgi:hypothetical protein